MPFGFGKKKEKESSPLSRDKHKAIKKEDGVTHEQLQEFINANANHIVHDPTKPIQEKLKFDHVTHKGLVTFVKDMHSLSGESSDDSDASGNSSPTTPTKSVVVDFTGLVPDYGSNA